MKVSLSYGFLSPLYRVFLYSLLIYNGHFLPPYTPHGLFILTFTPLSTLQSVLKPLSVHHSNGQLKLCNLLQAVMKVKVTKSLAFGSLYQTAFSKEKLTKSNTLDSPPVSRLPRHTALHRRSDSFTEACYKTDSAEQQTTPSPVEVMATPLTSESASHKLLSTDSIESVEADGIALGAECQMPLFDESSYNSVPDREVENVLERRTDSVVDAAEIPDQVYDWFGGSTRNEDADVTLTGSMHSDSEYDELDHPLARSPRKLARGRTVTGRKPCINIRGDSEHSDGECPAVPQC